MAINKNITYSEGGPLDGDGGIGVSFGLLSMGVAHESGRRDQSRESGVEAHGEQPNTEGGLEKRARSTGEKREREHREREEERKRSRGSYIERRLETVQVASSMPAPNRD